MPAAGENPGYVETVYDTQEAWIAALESRRDARDPPPEVDFRRERVAVVAQHARHAGYGGARFEGVRHEGGRPVVEYTAREPAPDGVHPMVYRGYVGFYVVLPREDGPPAFRRVHSK
jgi:hypothetical protein